MQYTVATHTARIHHGATTHVLGQVPAQLNLVEVQLGPRDTPIKVATGV